MWGTGSASGTRYADENTVTEVFQSKMGELVTAPISSGVFK